MPEALDSLSQRELLALAAEAGARSDSGHALAYLKAAAAREDRSPEALFLLGSEYAQLRLMEEAAACMGQAVALAPRLWIARFQLGLLHLTSGAPALAQEVWAPLHEMAEHDDKAYLKRFHQGLLHLIADEFVPAVRALQAGMAQNHDNAPLNHEMQRIVDAVVSLPGVPAVAPVAAPASPAAGDRGAAAPPTTAEPEVEVEPSHLFISAYATRGKPH